MRFYGFLLIAIIALTCNEAVPLSASFGQWAGLTGSSSSISSHGRRILRFNGYEDPANEGDNHANDHDERGITVVNNVGEQFLKLHGGFWRRVTKPRKYDHWVQRWVLAYGHQLKYGPFAIDEAKKRKHQD
ncbi:hypothetical protein F441_13992 [Phytophthora nicotianae CJ01A1]|uniref:RxLR effector protein n=3 Tax=Phytophthora nicotianae TaxID=4792 RepID=V9EQ10_PHYNI|nr:hypothetical protein F443_14066 [Phytophthora nicotianae P1569]ETO69270.1 hypothetical protein F444_14097 [Phytophthora nicotianae P1976]ETP10343.1 hypothetical protein F441_13992 [Phytophthora nicotianae CJ01A1]